MSEALGLSGYLQPSSLYSLRSAGRAYRDELYSTFIEALLNSGRDWAVILRALRKIVKRGDTRAIKAVSKLLEDPDEGVMISAGDCLVKMGTYGAAALAGMLLHEDPAVRTFSAYIIEK